MFTVRTLVIVLIMAIATYTIIEYDIVTHFETIVEQIQHNSRI